MDDWLTTTMKVLAGFWGVLSEMSPYLLFGFFVAGILSVWISPKLVERHLGGRGIWPVVKAAAFGVPLPLCSCGVIPVSASLRRHGASRGATTSFLISTPQTGIDSILVTFSLLGGVYAVFRPIAALISGIVAGSLVSLFERNGPAAEAEPPPAETCQEPCCAGGEPNRMVRAMKYGFGTLPRDIGRALLLGLIVAAGITAMVPRNYFADIVPPGIAQVLVLMAAGIPVYVCATASIPVAYALILTGVSPGAAFAFLMTGPATNAATIATIWKIMGWRTTVIYLLTMIVAAVGGGLLLDQLVEADQIVGGDQMRWMLPGAVKHASAVVLLGVVFWAVVGPYIHRPARREAKAAEIEIKITGMTCSHCQKAIRRALLACPAVTGAEVDLAGGRAIVSGESVDPAKLRAAVEELGYGVEGPFERSEQS